MKHADSVTREGLIRLLCVLRGKGQRQDSNTASNPGSDKSGFKFWDSLAGCPSASLKTPESREQLVCASFCGGRIQRGNGGASSLPDITLQQRVHAEDRQHKPGSSQFQREGKTINSRAVLRDAYSVTNNNRCHGNRPSSQPAWNYSQARARLVISKPKRLPEPQLPPVTQLRLRGRVLPLPSMFFLS